MNARGRWLACAPALLFASLAVAGLPAGAAAASRSDAAGFSRYQELLNDHLWTTSRPGEPLETRFNYEKFYDEPGRAERCARIRNQFATADLAHMDAKHRLAWAINFYNYLVIEQVTDHLLMPDKKRQRWLSVQDIKLDGEDFFKHPIVRIDTTSYSLNTFERHFVFADFDRLPGHAPPKKLDPRAHFALVCGAVACPPLQPRAYRADSLDLQLDDAVRSALASKSRWSFSQDPRALRLSSIFFWYAPDFGGRSHFISWALPYVPKDQQGDLGDKGAPPPAMSEILWDWKLNQVNGWRYYEEMAKPLPGVPHDH